MIHQQPDLIMMQHHFRTEDQSGKILYMDMTNNDVRREILLDATGDEVSLTDVDFYVRQQNPSASVPEVQNKTLGVIRSLVADGLCILGAMSGENGLFVPWNDSLDDSICRIADVYLSKYDDPSAWIWFAWLRITDKGVQVVREPGGPAAS